VGKRLLLFFTMFSTSEEWANKSRHETTHEQPHEVGRVLGQ
jgi:hypothetical protein